MCLLRRIIKFAPFMPCRKRWKCHTQFRDRVVDVPVVLQRQELRERILERIVEETDVPGPYVEEEIIEVVKLGSLEGVLNYIVEQSVDVPDPQFQEEIVEMVLLTGVCDEVAEWHDNHKKFYEQFVKRMKLGIPENSVDDFEIAELWRFKHVQVWR